MVRTCTRSVTAFRLCDDLVTKPRTFSTSIATSQQQQQQQQQRSRIPPLPPASSSLSLTQWSQHLHQPQDTRTPLLLRNLISRHRDGPSRRTNDAPGSVYNHPWPSLDKWSTLDHADVETLQGLRSVPGMEDRIVEVEVGRSGHGYMEATRSQSTSTWQKISMPFGIFIEAFILKKFSSDTEATEDLVGYVAQQDFFTTDDEAASHLNQHCPPLTHTLLGPVQDKEQYRRNLWIGPAGTFTPIHRDPYDNLFVQVVGSKRFHIFPPFATNHAGRGGDVMAIEEILYLERAGKQSNTSLIPTEALLLQRSSHSSSQQVERGEASFPLFQSYLSQSSLPPSSSSSTTTSTSTTTTSPVDGKSETAAASRTKPHHALLHPGDALYLPRGWFHCVSALSTSVSVNSWWR